MSCKQKSDHRRRKRVPAQIISFEEDDLAEQHLGSEVVSRSAPPTCLNSPASGMANVPIPVETVGAFVSKFINDSTETYAPASEEPAQKVSISIFVMISDFHAIDHETW
jgi:hypothetical protein